MFDRRCGQCGGNPSIDCVYRFLLICPHAKNITACSADQRHSDISACLHYRRLYCTASRLVGTIYYVDYSFRPTTQRPLESVTPRMVNVLLDFTGANFLAHRFCSPPCNDVALLRHSAVGKNFTEGVIEVFRYRWGLVSLLELEFLMSNGLIAMQRSCWLLY